MSKHKHYTQEQKKWVVNEVKKSKDHRWKTISDKFEKEFGHSRGARSLRSLAGRLGCQFKETNTNTAYTKEQDEWIRKHSERFTLNKLRHFYNYKFGEDRTYYSVRDKCVQLGVGWKRPKGGNEKKSLGSINYSTKGERTIKVGENPSAWMSLSRYVWEVQNKDEELGERVILHLDKNADNFRRENLVAVKKTTLIIANNLYKLTDNAEINRTILLLAEVKAEAYKKAREYEKESSKSS